MKTKTMICISALILATGLALNGCGNAGNETNGTQTEESADVQEKAALYACPMHPEETSDNPGTCSKCGMDLEKPE
ncbi:MAG: heavy metal-binding domain-containing protein [Flavobacteriales bacterium]